MLVFQPFPETKEILKKMTYKKEKKNISTENTIIDYSVM